MQLKVIVVTLIIASLSHQSAASVVTAPTASIPGFNFIPSVFRNVKLDAGSGSLQGFNTIENTTTWQPIANDNSGAITQNVVLSNLTANYTILARWIFLKSNGQLSVHMGGNTFNLTLNATIANGTCQLTVNVRLTPQPFSISLDTSALPLLIQVQSVLIGPISDFVSGFLTGLVPPLLQNLVQQRLSNTPDFNQLCYQVANANETDFPQPSL